MAKRGRPKVLERLTGLEKRVTILEEINGVTAGEPEPAAQTGAAAPSGTA